MDRWQVEFYQLPDGNSPALDWFRKQEAKVQAKFARIFELLQANDTVVEMPHVRPIKKLKAV